MEAKVFEKEPNVIIVKSPKKAIIRNTETGKSMVFYCKTKIDIVSALIPDLPIIVDIAARNLGIDENRFMSLLKKLAKKKFVKDVSKNPFLPEDENNNSVSTVSNN